MKSGELCYLTSTCVSAGDRKQVFHAGTRFRFGWVVSELKEISGGRVTASEEQLSEPVAVVYRLNDLSRSRLLFPLSALSPVRVGIHKNGTLTK